MAGLGGKKDGHPGRGPGGTKGNEASRGRKPNFSMPEKTAAWAGLPGKTQPRDRSNGIKKMPNAHVKSEGI